MNGAEALVRTLVANNVTTCFANPGTSEMHFLAALDRVPGMRSILVLHENVATGAADGYARMTGLPAATLLHLGPGLVNGLSNLHNAGRAGMPVVNIVGDHATYHRNFDAPLTSDIEGAARPFCSWVRTSASADQVAIDGAAAVAAAQSRPGRIACLILPADTAWNEIDDDFTPPAMPDADGYAALDGRAVDAAAEMLRQPSATVILLAGEALHEPALSLAGRLAAETGARLMAQTTNPRIERGAGRIEPERLPFPIDQAIAALADVHQLLLIGARAPVAFFAYPDKPSRLTPSDCRIQCLSRADQNPEEAIRAVLNALNISPSSSPPAPVRTPEVATGTLTLESLGQSIGALLPEGAIVVDEAMTSGRSFTSATRFAAPHDWLQNMGGSIGYGPPLATGCAIAQPGRRVVCLEGDGCAMYTLQALWTQARERLGVTTIVFANRSYAILRHELAKVGAGNPGPALLGMLSLENPTIDWVKLAQGMGVEAVRVEDMLQFNTAFRSANRHSGPMLIEVVL